MIDQIVIQEMIRQLGKKVVEILQKRGAPSQQEIEKILTEGVLGIAREYDARITAAEGILDAHQDRHTEIIANFKEVHSRIDDTNKELAATNKRIDETNKRIDDTNKRIDETNKQLAATNKRIDDTNKELAATNIRLDETNKRIDETNATVDKLGKRLDKRIDKLGKRLDKRIERASKDTNKRLDEMNRNLTMLVLHLTGSQTTQQPVALVADADQGAAQQREYQSARGTHD